MPVSDRAKGIPAAQHAEAVRKFGRLDRARSKPGSGLGLSLVKAVASLHRGELVLAEESPGAPGYLILPRDTDPFPSVK